MDTFFEFLSSVSHLSFEQLAGIIALSSVLVAGFAIYAVLVIAKGGTDK